MKLASSLFLVLLVHAHGGTAPDQALGRPLSMFRDGPQAWQGQAMFAALLLSGVLYTASLVRCRREGEAAVAGFAVLLLLVVAATSSLGAVHGFCSFLLLFVLFAHYALLLRRAGGVWIVAHLTVPVVLMLATQFHSYGLWQKGLVVYFLAAAVLHHHVLTRFAADAKRSGRRGLPLRRRTVYELVPGRPWPKHRGRRAGAARAAD
jgi:hypothetical protein